MDQCQLYAVIEELRKANREQAEMIKTLQATIESLKEMMLVKSPLPGTTGPATLDTSLTQAVASSPLKKTLSKQLPRAGIPTHTPPVNPTTAANTKSMDSINPATAQTTSQSRWADVAARYRPLPRRPKKLMPVSRASRLLSPPEPNSAFKFIYLSRRGRIPVHQIRQCLQALGIPQSRILHVSFPARNIVALLIHSGFEPEITSILTQHSIQLHQQFNPCSGDILEDPKFQNGSYPA